MFAYNDKVTRAHLVIINSAKGSIESDVEEFISLILSAGAAINDITYVDSQRFYRRSLIGSGKIQEIKEQVVNKCSDLVVFNHPLTPSQERNLEKKKAFLSLQTMTSIHGRSCPVTWKYYIPTTWTVVTLVFMLNPR